MGIQENKGFSLVELVIVIAILAILSAVAVPSILSWLRNKDLHAASRNLYSVMRKTQSMAVKENKNCVVTFSGQSYRAYVERSNPPNTIFDAGTDEEIANVNVADQYPNATLSQNFNNGRVVFQPNMLIAGSFGGTVTFTATGSGRQERVVVNASGGIRME